MAKDGKNGKKGKPARRRARRARRDVKLQYQPWLSQIKRGKKDIKQAYRGFGHELGQIPEFDYSGISGQLGNEMSQYADLLTGAGVPGLEQAAGGKAYGGWGAGAIGQLGTMQGTDAMYRASAEREGALSKRQALEDIAQQKIDIKAMFPQLIKQRMDELKQQHLTNMLARSQLKTDEATRQWIMDEIGRLTAEKEKKPPKKEPPRRFKPDPRDWKNEANWRAYAERRGWLD